MKWMEQAECADWDLTYQDPWHDPLLERLAKSVCSACPVLDDCAGYAIQHGLWYGIWGGMNEKERSVWARRHNLARHGTLTGYTTDRCRCVLCQRAATEYDQKHRGRTGRQPAECGTYTGAIRHYKKKTTLCGPCREAYREYQRERRFKKTA